MACFVYHMKSCPRRRLILVLTHGERSSSSTIVQLAIVARRLSEPSKKARDLFPINWIASTLAGRTN
eukprot:12799850-Ditylum_brightwellii.AAC.1